MSDEVIAAQVMQADVRTVSPQLPVVELEELLVGKRIGGAPVVDDGRLVGVVSRSDIVRHLAGEYAAESIATEYYWDFGGTTTLREAGSSALADASTVEKALTDLTVRDLMIEDIISVVPETPVSLVAQLMLRHQIHRVLVVDGSRLVGLVTTMDLTRLLADGRAVARS
jgi:CBS domain-containing protein